VWGRIGGKEAVALLEDRLRFPSARARYDVLVALRACRYRASGPAAAAVENAIRSEVEDAAWKSAVRQDLGDAPELALVRSALDTEVRAAQARLLLLLSFILDPNAIKRASDNLHHESRDRRAYAVEMLDVTLPAEWRTLLMPLFEEATAEQRAEKLAALFPQTPRASRDRVKELLRQPPGRLATWTIAAVLHATVTLKVGDAGDVITNESASTMLRETADWAKAKLADEATGSHPVGASDKRRAMLTIEKVIILKSVHMFGEASDEILADVASIVEEVDVAAGEVVFRKGDAGDSMYVIVDGSVRVYDGEREIIKLGARDIFGELALLDPEPRLASVAAVGATRLLRLDREAFLELMEANIEIVRGVLHVLCERLRRLSVEVKPYTDDPSPAR
jgi:hypothetical protein